MWKDKLLPANIFLLSEKQKAEQGLNHVIYPRYNSRDILYYYDGPVSFFSEYGGSTKLFTKLDEGDFVSKDDDLLYWEVWAVIAMSDEDIRSLRANEKPFRDYWFNRSNFIVEVVHDKSVDALSVSRVWKDVIFATKWLPDPGVKLFMER